MKIISAVAVLFLTGSVSFAQGRVKPVLTQKPVSVGHTTTTRTTPSSPNTTPTIGIEGTVRVSTDCGSYIEVVENGIVSKYYPLNLPAEMVEDGKTIVFDYVIDRGNLPVDCRYNKVVTLNNVK